MIRNFEIGEARGAACCCRVEAIRGNLEMDDGSDFGSTGLLKTVGGGALMC